MANWLLTCQKELSNNSYSTQRRRKISTGSEIGNQFKLLEKRQKNKGESENKIWGATQYVVRRRIQMQRVRLHNLVVKIKIKVVSVGRSILILCLKSFSINFFSIWGNIAFLIFINHSKNLYLVYLSHIGLLCILFKASVFINFHQVSAQSLQFQTISHC